MRFFCVFFFLIGTSLLYAGSDGDRLSQYLNNMQTMQADFSQTVNNPKGKTTQTIRGEMAFKKPNQFRWVINDPDQQLIIADGTYLWIYDIDLEQVIRKNLQRELANTPALFLSRANYVADEEYDVKQLKKNNKGTTFELLAKSKQQPFYKVCLTFSKDGHLTRMQLYDSLDQVTTITFDHIKGNHTLSPALFKFSMPKQVDLLIE